VRAAPRGNNTCPLRRFPRDRALCRNKPPRRVDAPREISRFDQRPLSPLLLRFAVSAPAQYTAHPCLRFIPPSAVKSAAPVTLDALRPGEHGAIVAFNADADLYRRFAALGLRAGKQVSVLRRARFAGPLLIRAGTTDVMLRVRDARCIFVQINGKPSGGPQA